VQKISQELSSNFLWELRGIPSAEEDLPPLKAEFNIQFRPASDPAGEWRKFNHHFDIADYSVLTFVFTTLIALIDGILFQTLFTVRSRVDPVKGNDFLRAGSLCHMTLTVNTVRQNADGGTSTALMYEVLADQALWAVCGRTAGVFSMEGASKHSVTLDVMPLVCGFLPLPAVRLSRYIPADQKQKGLFNQTCTTIKSRCLDLYSFSQKEQVVIDQIWV
jgi:trafficking protein particle complex subunit 10